jgi:hypothetical protein
MTTGENLAAALADCRQRSPVPEVTAESNCLVCAVVTELTVPAGAGARYGPHSSGVAIQTPAVTLPPAGL